MMVQNKKPSLQDLIDRSGMNDADIAKSSDVSDSTLRNMKQGKRVKRKLRYRVLNFLNTRLNTTYDLIDIDGLEY